MSSIETGCLVEIGDGNDENSVVEGDGDSAQLKKAPNLDEPGDLGSGLLVSGGLLESMAVVGGVETKLARSTFCKLRCGGGGFGAAMDMIELSLEWVLYADSECVSPSSSTVSGGPTGRVSNVCVVKLMSAFTTSYSGCKIEDSDLAMTGLWMEAFRDGQRG